MWKASRLIFSMADRTLQSLFFLIIKEKNVLWCVKECEDHWGPQRTQDRHSSRTPLILSRRGQPHDYVIHCFLKYDHSLSKSHYFFHINFSRWHPARSTSFALYGYRDTDTSFWFLNPRLFLVFGCPPKIKLITKIKIEYVQNKLLGWYIYL